MRRLLLATLVLSGAAGCQKNDTATLARIGRKVAERGQETLGDLRGRLDLKWVPPSGEPGVGERVRLRLRHDKRLGDLGIEVKEEGAAVALHGKVTDTIQKQTARELAETTRGVEQVTDHLVVEAPGGVDPPHIGPPQDVPPEMPPPMPEGMEPVAPRNPEEESQLEGAAHEASGMRRGAVPLTWCAALDGRF